MSDTNAADEILPIRAGLVSWSEESPDEIRLLGSRCSDCHEVSIGTNAICLNCGGDNIESTSLEAEGELWTYTIVRHRPPGDYLGPDPFEPFAIGLVELPDGVRIMTPLAGDPQSLKIGTQVRLEPWELQSKDGQHLRAFRFAPA